MQRCVWLLFMGLYLCLGICVGKGPAAETAYIVTGAASPVKIDGVLDEAAWQEALKVPLPFEWTPGDNTPAPVQSECLITFSKTDLLIGFRCFDPEPQKVRAHLMNRDALATFLLDDYVIVVMDTFNDERRAFQFRVNPLGVQADAIYSESEGYEDFSWDAIWKSKGRITDFGYVVEMAIPFNQLRFPHDREKQTWGFSLARSYPRKVRYRLGAHKSDRNRRCYLCQAVKIHGFVGMSPGKNLEFDPTLTARRTDEKEDFPAGEMKTGKVKVEPGLSWRWGITPNLILNGAVNPDFSQVEADAAQLEVNTRFALRYPEKRPFFLEGSDFFLTPMEAVFTRTVYDPRWGAKLTGKIGRNALGLFTAQDRYNNLLFPANQGSVSTSIAGDVFGGVFRYRQDVGKGSTVGLLYTGRSADDYYNHVAGVDTFMRLSRTKFVNFQYLYSSTRYPGDIAANFNQPTGPFGGHALFFNFRHIGRDFNYGVDYSDLWPRFRADYGFMPRVDFRRYNAYIQPKFWGNAGSWFNQLSFWLLGERITDHGGSLTDQHLEIGANYQGPFQTIVMPTFSIDKEYYNGVIYDMKRWQTYIEMRPIGGLKYYISARVGDAVDYANGRLAHSFFISPGIECSFGEHWSMKLSHILERLSCEGQRIYTANLLQAQLVYNFNIRTFVRAIAQYTDIRRSTAMYQSPVDPETKVLFTQFLFSYKLNPQTVLFLGYSDNHYGLYGLDISRADRTFFLKIGYALVL
jgi:hypothetical protein